MSKTWKQLSESYDFGRAALAKQRLMNLKGKNVRGARIANLMRAAGIREEEMTDEDIGQLDEVLTKDAEAGDWIHDFVHSSNPKFEGKSKKERIRMALGAYYAKQRNEEKDYGTHPEDKADEKEDVKLIKKVVKKDCINKESVSVVKDASGKVVSWKKESDWKKSDPKKNPEGKVHNLVGQALEKTKQMNKEEFEQFLEEAVKQYAGLEKEPKKGLPSGAVKASGAAVKSDSVEGWDHPKKAVKEEYDEEGNLTHGKISYSDFMSNLLEYNTDSGRYVHKGTYGYGGKGAKFGQTDYDKETLDTKEDEGGEQPVKRGRGRPAGSKSGARGPRIK